MPKISSYKDKRLLFSGLDWKKTDCALGRELGIKPNAVLYWRRKLGKAAHARGNPNWR